MPGSSPHQVDTSKMTPLMHAAKSGSLEIVIELCQRDDTKAQINATDDDRMNALEHALLSSNHKQEIFFEIFKIPGIDVNGDTAERKKHGQQTLNYAINACLYEDIESIVDALLNMPGIDVNRTDSNGMSVLMTAAYQENPKLIVKLRATGQANVNIKDNRGGNTALLWAARLLHSESIKELLKFDGIDTTAECSGKTALAWCLESKYYTGAEAILKHKGYNCTLKNTDDVRKALDLVITKGDAQTKKEILASKVITYVPPKPAPKPPPQEEVGGCTLL